MITSLIFSISFNILLLDYIILEKKLLKKLINFLQNIIHSYKNENNIQKELIVLLDHMIAYSKAGVQLPQSFQFLCLKYTWSKEIKEMLKHVLQSFEKGFSFSDAINECLNELRRKKHAQSICKMLASIDIAFCTGENAVIILSTLKKNIQKSIQLNEKLKILTTQMRYQSFIINSIPSFLFIIIHSFSPEHFSFFFKDTIGFLLFSFLILLNIFSIILLRMIQRII